MGTGVEPIRMRDYMPDVGTPHVTLADDRQAVYVQWGDGGPTYAVRPGVGEAQWRVPHGGELITRDEASAEYDGWMSEEDADEAAEMAADAAWDDAWDRLDDVLVDCGDLDAQQVREILAAMGRAPRQRIA